MPKSTPVAIEIPVAKSSTAQVRRAAAGSIAPNGRSDVMMLTVQLKITSPAMPPSAASRHDSSSSWRTS